ncbi:hypothetical protein AUEXF2481DRAFT_32090 [Aureobasidium subglaciale EXF-2481]|uniref:Far11/STRP C-terminal domain-containing protein n=1 Tax=Aureobasidium subglaciale (strain EXF-2481) TaxID=1043005 RepID=A0A074Y3X5_AURSE|nr:uncharacterized protein AUEXF2481DRAFT_32090 [Aureobasidium subglaciale EXF-2481]KAI5210859.1 hypothetical protein E4T38_01780 [Aureobasidium subglaciale]KAI5229294.1 hypothetical protein E4T40_01700 [Aureobasidium subglaciale]KAI5232915.1 hypothetical protein E4T41_01778 [Aureobasidium subglaciale]KAI5266273.1 hypothetical protein E4T46_01697 [Aureobasidium subglaciale]KEQ92498.1 hypothetical protein AUEXF2481DRAFT_32090 [Aureobasidium subglaciale EXF-2481]
MDEVENPAVKAPEEESDSIVTPAKDTAEQLHLDNAPVIPPADSPTGNDTSSRPLLNRNSSAPPPRPQSQVSDIDPSQDPPDSLTLAQLKNLRAGFPVLQAHLQQPVPLSSVYDFEYRDSQSFPVELEEWFTYSEKERAKLCQINAAFEHAWRAHTARDTVPDWTASPEMGMAFVANLLHDLQLGTPHQKNQALQVLTYISLGTWEETAGRETPNPFFAVLGSNQPQVTAGLPNYAGATYQIQIMINTLCMLAQQGAVPLVYGLMKSVCERDLTASAQNEDASASPKYTEGDESIDVWCTLTLVYLFVELSRISEGTPDAHVLHRELALIKPDLLITCTNMIAQMRWDDFAPVPQTKIFLLLWKTILISFGGIEAADKVKHSFQENIGEKDERGHPLITASPLDYHLFRQEITSKYPAYQPPPPLFAFEPENNTILPPLRHRQTKIDSNDNTASTGTGVHGSSILHQAVHIATPAPSPPPSPAGPGGKGGKKQNYQTNQMFPFLYPPLDESSNDLGGKGSTELQDALAGRKWRGSDVPASILEAAELFSKRMRATRAMKQLWDTRIDYMRSERGWFDVNVDSDVDQFDLYEPQTNGVSHSDDEESSESPEKPKIQEPLSENDKILEAVANFYRDVLPQMQSVVFVLLKGMARVYADTTANPQAPAFENGHVPDGISISAEQVDASRSTEITGKAVSAILLLLLKWFKLSHVLRFEYLNQLLLDSGYIIAVLRIWQWQDIGRACHFMLDRPELDFFSFCRANSRNPIPSEFVAVDDTMESEDEAMPPPIKFRRESEAISEVSASSVPPDYTTHPPEVDELGYPTQIPPPAPIQTYSYRNTFTYINYLRVLQKITRRKAHRSLLLVSYKSSNVLKKSLRVPVDMMRYYTLKLFKTQVPYCGRKWRQSNMKIITAVWLSVPSELRDDWLSGGGGGMGGAGPGDVDGTVEEALPLEQSLRSLTHWWNVHHYPDKMGVDRKLVTEEQDFFARELEKMDLGRMEEEMMEESLIDDAWAQPMEGYA